MINRYPVARGLFGLLALIPVAIANIRPIYTTQKPSAVGFTFESGDKVTFNVVGGRLQTIDFRVSGRSYSASFIGCPAIEHLQFDSVTFDSDPSRPQMRTFGLAFHAGPEDSRQFGELPGFQVDFFKGHLRELLITHKTGPNSYYSAPFCPAIHTAE
jgi:hypothetical protein